MARGLTALSSVIAGMPANMIGALTMGGLTHGQPVERGVVADIAGYVPAAGAVTRSQRQEARYKLRSSLRRITSLKRLSSCGLPLGGFIIVRCMGDVNHYSGISTCGSGWCCPVCASKIRFHRAHEVSRAVVSALDKGMSALFVTRTIPHSAEDKLGVTLGLLAEGRRYVFNQKLVKVTRKSAGPVGSIASKELTHGHNGWHPHTHDIEFYERELSLEDFAALSALYYHYLTRFYSLNGFDGLPLPPALPIIKIPLTYL